MPQIAEPVAAPLTTSQRVARLNQNDRPFHVVLAQQFDKKSLEELCRLSEMVRAIHSDREGARFLRELLSHRRAMLYFIQPSTRTFLSFAAACQILGMPYDEVRNPSTSSEVKGETEDDTIRVLSQYFDLIIMRHPKEGFAEQMANLLSGARRKLPLINGGSGKDQHPTQALLDLYTLYRCFAPKHAEPVVARLPDHLFAGKTIAFVGDLKRGRTVRSLVYLLCRYAGIRMLFISPPELQIGEDILEYVQRYGVAHETLHDLRPAVPECDAIYMTRLQDEYDVAGESRDIDYARFHLTEDLASLFKPELAILHPLPRRHELARGLDHLPQAKYWEQVRNGMWIRAALIAYVFQSDTAIIDHFHSYYAR